MKKYELPLNIFGDICCGMLGKVKEFTGFNAEVIYPKNLGSSDAGLILYVFSDKKVFSFCFTYDDNYTIQTYKISNINCMNYSVKSDGNNKLEIYFSQPNELRSSIEFDSSKDTSADVMRLELKNIITHIFKELIKES